jgi:hypothetical protein
MSKNDATRVTEIINFLCNEVPGSERTAVRAFLTDARPFAVALSDEMSSQHVAHAGNATERMRRRALLMLCGINNRTDNEINQIRGLQGLPLKNLLDARILTMRYAADQAKGTEGLLRQLFNHRLFQNPAQFLAANALLIYGSNVDGVVDQIFEYVWKFYQFKIIPPPSGQAHPYQFRTINVPAVPWDLVPNRTVGNTFAGIVGTELIGSQIMISTQFTGCSFCFKEVNGRLFAAHIMPDNGAAGGYAGGGPGLAQALAGLDPLIGAGDFANAPPGGVFRVYGRGYSNIATRPGGYNYAGPPAYMTIIGFRKAGVWEIYSQEVNAAKAIGGPYRIY